MHLSQKVRGSWQARLSHTDPRGLLPCGGRREPAFRRTLGGVEAEASPRGRLDVRGAEPGRPVDPRPPGRLGLRVSPRAPTAAQCADPGLCRGACTEGVAGCLGPRPRPSAPGPAPRPGGSSQAPPIFTTCGAGRSIIGPRFVLGLQLRPLSCFQLERRRLTRAATALGPSAPEPLPDAGFPEAWLGPLATGPHVDAAGAGRARVRAGEGLGPGPAPGRPRPELGTGPSSSRGDICK